MKENSKDWFDIFYITVPTIQILQFYGTQRNQCIYNITMNIAGS